MEVLDEERFEIYVFFHSFIVVGAKISLEEAVIVLLRQLILSLFNHHSSA